MWGLNLFLLIKVNNDTNKMKIVHKINENVNVIYILKWKSIIHLFHRNTKKSSKKYVIPTFHVENSFLIFLSIRLKFIYVTESENIGR